MEDILVVTTENVAGYKTVKTIGEAFGIVSRARHMFSDMGAALKSGTVGGEIKAYTKLINETRSDAISRLKENAEKLGANAVVMMRFDTEEIKQGVSVTVAYGTAVLIEKQ